MRTDSLAYSSVSIHRTILKAQALALPMCSALSLHPRFKRLRINATILCCTRCRILNVVISWCFLAGTVRSHTTNGITCDSRSDQPSVDAGQTPRSNLFLAVNWEKDADSRRRSRCIDRGINSFPITIRLIIVVPTFSVLVSPVVMPAFSVFVSTVVMPSPTIMVIIAESRPHSRASEHCRENKPHQYLACYRPEFTYTWSFHKSLLSWIVFNRLFGVVL
jgi:hypothetical protein